MPSLGIGVGNGIPAASNTLFTVFIEPGNNVVGNGSSQLDNQEGGGLETTWAAAAMAGEANQLLTYLGSMEVSAEVFNAIMSVVGQDGVFSLEDLMDLLITSPSHSQSGPDVSIDPPLPVGNGSSQLDNQEGGGGLETTWGAAAMAGEANQLLPYLGSMEESAEVFNAIMDLLITSPSHSQSGPDVSIDPPLPAASGAQADPPLPAASGAQADPSGAQAGPSGAQAGPPAIFSLDSQTSASEWPDVPSANFSMWSPQSLASDIEGPSANLSIDPLVPSTSGSVVGPQSTEIPQPPTGSLLGPENCHLASLASETESGSSNNIPHNGNYRKRKLDSSPHSEHSKKSKGEEKDVENETEEQCQKEEENSLTAEIERLDSEIARLYWQIAEMPRHPYT